ncbi:hypothetical protein GUITHDRAFT_101475 [Guillardia theta CCMP2712]|uniref:Uncharacterized protein n=1 Tax=Guillardia theta (strain CCMP2712) TaxID=905079 RepID=L1JXE1_GUITC|nr:hypothetical protein GUITHDRAFT_101475 [Guillardia theta CCMP2712]EKX53032.1 hypothetical protein GUITHDRAFT_101475 [Guillardia theta CCMP2712]|eukprot:XP_005840012.1 hypothetical protein GUITHDRAFT_101475 [Guillardia theta CCMP2712]
MTIAQYKPYDRAFCRIFNESMKIDDGWYYLYGPDRNNVYKYNQRNGQCTVAFPMDDKRMGLSYDLYYKHYFDAYEDNKDKPDAHTKLTTQGIPYLDYCDPKALPFWDSLVRGGKSQWYVHADFPNRIFFKSWGEYCTPEDVTARSMGYIEKYKDFWPDEPIVTSAKRKMDDDDIVVIKKCIKLLNDIIATSTPS